MPESVWQGEPARLDSVIAQLGLARSRTQAAEFIARGEVSVAGKPATKPGLKVGTGEAVAVAAGERYVSRAAHKLVAGLDAFSIDATGRIALDIGASTGGFTQVLLERGARAVQAIDVGHGQFAPELAGDARISLVEGCNARDLTPQQLAADTGIAEAPSLVVADLSFISLRLIFPAIARTAPGADLVLLVKPQFEVGRVRDGVVTNPEQWAEALRIAQAAALENGFAVRGMELSPIAGGHGNREFLVHFTVATAADTQNQQEWAERVAALCGIAASAPLGAHQTGEGIEGI